MNWFKMLKISYPIEDTPYDGNYIDIGHMYHNDNANDIIILWIIKDELGQLNIKTKKIKRRDERGHIRFPEVGNDEFVAQGRYDPGNKKCSFVFNYYLEDKMKHSMTRMRMMIKNIEEILDQTFDYPQILKY